MSRYLAVCFPLFWPIFFCCSGCVSSSTSNKTAIGAHIDTAFSPVVVPQCASETIRQAGWQTRASAHAIDKGAGLEALKELSVDAVVEQVLARNPTLAQMTAAWQAASERIPQVTSWDDPTFTGVLAPASLGSNTVDGGFRVEISQKIYFPGKLQLRGANAAAQASASGNDYEDARLQLIEAAKIAFFDYYLVDRALSVNVESLKLLNQLRKEAEKLFEAGKVQQQDVFQADVEIGRQNERRVTLERIRKVAQARINTLMHMPPNSPLLPTAQQTVQALALPPADELQALAVEARPDLKALMDRIAGEEASLALAYREYYPDFEVGGAYDSIMGNGPSRDLAPQITLKVNLPVRLRKRDAGVRESFARLAQKRAELASRVDQVHLQVQEGYEQLQESDRIVKLYEKSILPSAQSNIKAALVAYPPGKIPFLSLIEAQRNLVNLRDRYFEVTADYFRRRATLERVIGGLLPSLEKREP